MRIMEEKAAIGCTVTLKSDVRKRLRVIDYIITGRHPLVYTVRKYPPKGMTRHDTCMVIAWRDIELSPTEGA